MGLWPVTGPIAPLMVSNFGRCSVGYDLAAMNSGSIGNISLTANRALLVPIYVPSDMLVRKFMYITNTTPSGTIDMGLYDDAFTRIVSKGSTAIGGASALVEMDVTDTPIDRGMYYLALSASASGTSVLVGGTTGTVSLTKVVGSLIQDTAHPLPATLTPVVVTNAVLPLVGISQRVLVA